jgi:hypothetical protein
LMAALQVGDRAEDAAADTLAGHLRKERLNGIEPGGRGWGEMEDPARVVGQASALGCLCVA